MGVAARGRAGDPELADELLLAGFATGDRQLAIAFVRRFQAPVFGVALGVLADPEAAADVAQRCFERAWRHAEGYDALRGSVRAWLVGIAHHLAVDTARARARHAAPVDPAVLLAVLTPTGAVPEAREAAVADGDGLRRALAALPLEQARAVVLAAVHGYTAREIADQERIPLGTAKTRIRAAVGKLHAALSTDTRP